MKKNKKKKKRLPPCASSESSSSNVAPHATCVGLGINFEALVELDADEGPLEEYRPGADPDGDLPELSRDDLLALGGGGEHGASAVEDGTRLAEASEASEVMPSTAEWIASHRTQHSPPSRAYTKVTGHAKVRTDHTSDAGAIGERRRNPFAELFGDNDTDDNEDEEDE